jgi:hypothetical protein
MINLHNPGPGDVLADVDSIHVVRIILFKLQTLYAMRVRKRCGKILDKAK